MLKNDIWKNSYFINLARLVENEKIVSRMKVLKYRENKVTQ